MNKMKNCINSRWVLNPALPVLLQNYDKFTDGTNILSAKAVFHNSFSNIADFPYKLLKRFLYSIPNPESYKILCFQDWVSMFVEVNCNKCANCQTSRLLSMEQRLRFHAEQYKQLPFFIVLTYDNVHCPNKLNYREIQLFNKRLRKHFQFTFFVSGEHGKHRPHWHYMLYTDANINLLELHDLLEKTWQKGMVYCQQVGQKVKQLRDGQFVACTGNPFKYTCKYVAKENSLCRWSKGLGVSFAKQIGASNHMFNTNCVVSPHYRDKFGVLQRVIVNSWFLDCVFGNVSRETYRLRSAIQFVATLDLDIAKSLLYKAKNTDISYNFANLTKSNVEFWSTKKFSFGSLYSAIRVAEHEIQRLSEIADILNSNKAFRAVFCSRLDNKITHQYRLQNNYVNTRKLHFQLQNQIL